MRFLNNPASGLLCLLMWVSCLILFPASIHAQEPDESEMENLAGRNDAESFETDEARLNEQTARIDLNKVDAAILMSTGMVTEEQVAAFINYRRLLGNFVSIYEIQAIPGWDLELIGKLKTYIVVADGSRWSRSGSRLRPRAESQLIIRAGRQIERSRAYFEKDSLGNSHYLGKPGQLYIRYRLSLKNAFHAGFTAGKDAGELPGKGFDFYSFHLWLNLKGWLKYLAIGDYSVSMGQGLIHWQGLSFPKSSDLGLLNRQAQTIRPYQSSGESRFHRGLAAGWKIGNWQGATFAAEDLKDANLETGAGGKITATSIIESGYHRSALEIADKNVFHQLVLGGNLGFQKKTWQINANFIHYGFNYPIKKQDLPYNLFAISGKSWSNCSIDYSLNLDNYRLFGELARDARGAMAGLAGMVMSVDPALDLGILYRNFGARFRSMEASAFTESSEPANESGLWLGLNLRPSRYLSFAAFADFFNFPWLKYRVDAPSNGVDYLLKGDWHPDKLFHMESRLRFNRKAANDSIAFGVHRLLDLKRMSWRNQFNFEISRVWTIRSRVELNGYRSESNEMKRGFLTNLDIFCHLPKSLFGFNLRLEWFDTDAYDSRIYSYENDLPNFYNVPALFGRGFRYYSNIKISYHAKFTMGLKWAQTIFQGVEKFGSGWDEVKGKKRSDLRVELLIKF